MKHTEQLIEIPSFSQASFAPYTRGYNTLPITIQLITENTIKEKSFVLHSFKTDDIKEVLNEAILSHDSIISVRLQTPLDPIDFIASIRGLRALLAVHLENNNHDSNTKQFHFLLPIINTHETSHTLLIAQWAQIDTLVCRIEDENGLKLLLSYFETPPIDALFGNQTLEKKTNQFISEVIECL